MLRQSLTKWTAYGPKKLYNQKQLKMLTSSFIESKNFMYPEKLEGQVLLKGLPTLQRLREQYPDAKTPEPSVYDKLEQASYNKLNDITYTGNRGYSKLKNLDKQGRLFEYPIDSSKYNWYDEKIPTAEKNVDWTEHADFVEKNLSVYKFQGKNAGSANQLYFFLEAVGQGLSKNPYMTLNEKLDEAARYVQYFVFKEQELLGTQLLTKEQFAVYQSSELAKRHIKKDHWTREGYQARYDWRDSRASPIDTARPEYFWLIVPNEKHRTQLKEFFGKNYVDVSKTSSKPKDPTTKLSNPEHLVCIRNFGTNAEGKIKQPADAEFHDLKKFKFENISYEQIEMEGAHVRPVKNPAYYFDEKGPYQWHDGKRVEMKNQMKIGSGVTSVAQLNEKWFSTRYRRKLKAKRARIKKQAGK